MALKDNRKRARSEAEKEARMQAILAAARDMIGESGFDGVTMAGLARRAGLAKGTLYLYVRTKEELFLALFVAAMEDFLVRFEAEARAETLVEDLTRLAREVPLFLPLYARLTAVIEVAVSGAALFAAKRRIGALSARFIAHLARLSGADEGRAAEVGQALMLTMQGAAQFDITARRPQ
ncbi:MAG: TetR/AcrR family transcriptional regulator, partial [Alphaproteobacteria bacterium]